MSESAARRSSRPAWSRLPLLRPLAALTVMVVLVGLGVPGDIPLPEPVAVTCDSVGYAYDAAGRLVGVQDQTNQTARYRYDQVGNLLSVANDGTPDLAVLSVVPAQAAAGEQVTIEGGCFSDVPVENLVFFQGAAAPAEVVHAEARRVVAVVPPDAVTGPVTVQVGEVSAASPAAFEVEDGSAAPAVGGVSPTLAAPGDTVTVTGSGFGIDPTATKVTLNRTRALVAAASPASIELEVPAGAGSGRVAVATAYGQSESAQDVFVAPPPYAVAEIAHAARTGFGESQTVSIPTAGQLGMLIFDLDAGERGSVVLSGGTFGSCGISTARVRDPFGNTVASDGCAGSSGFLGPFEATVAGTYTLLLPAGDAATGSIDAVVHQVPADTSVPVVAGGDPVTLTTQTPGQDAVATFEGLAGQRVSVVAWDGGVSSYLAGASLRDPDGVVLASDSSCGGSCFLDTLTLPADGTYTIRWDPEAAHAGSITVQVYEVPPDAAASTAPGTGAVTVATSVPGQDARVAFVGTAGQVVTVTAFGGSVTSYLAEGYLRGPGGELLDSDTSCGATCGFDYVTLPADGSYEFHWDPDWANTGEIAVYLHDTVDDVMATTAAGDPPVTVTTTAPGQNAVVSFDGTAGQAVTVTAFDGSVTSYLAEGYLRGPGGEVVGSDTSCGVTCGFSASLPSDGSYEFFWDPAADQTGQMSVAVHDAADDAVATTTPGAGPVTVATTVPGQLARVEFEGTAGQVMTAVGSGGSLASYLADGYLRGPGGELLDSDTNCGTGCTFEYVALPADGTYAFVWDPNDALTGQITVQVHDNDVGGDIVATAQRGGDPVTVTTGTPGQIIRVRFDAAAGDPVTVTGFAGTFGSSGAAASLLDPNGTVLDSDTSCGSSCAFPQPELPATGTYTLLVDPAGDATGSITVQVHDSIEGDDIVVSTEPGADPVTVHTGLPGQRALVEFDGTAGQQVAVTAFDGDLASTRAAGSLHGPGDESLGSDTSCGATCGFDYVTLPADGTYTFAWQPDAGYFGQFSLSVHDTDDDTTVASELGAGPVTLTTTVPGQNAVVEFEGNAGQVVAVTAFGGDLSSTRAEGYLRAPDGSTLDSDTSCGAECAFDYVTLPEDGEYRFWWDADAADTGSIAVYLHDTAADVSVVTEAGAAPVALTITVPGQNAVVEFEGNAGQVVAVTAFDGDLSSTRAEGYLRAPDGSTLDSDTSCGAECAFDYVTLPEDGTYSFLWDPDYAYTGSITVSVHNTANDATATVSIGDPAVTLPVTMPGQNAVVEFEGTAGQVVAVTAFGGDLSSTRAEGYLRAPDGSTLGSDTSCGAECAFDYVTLPEDGTYSFLWDPDYAYTGQISVVVHDTTDDALASVAVGDPAVTLATTVPGQNAVVEFEGTAGQVVTLTASGGDLSSTRAEGYLRAPDGSTMDSDTSCGTGCEFAEMALPEDGTYSFLWDPDYAYTGSITVQVSADAVAASATAESWVPDRFQLAGEDWRSHRATGPAVDAAPLAADPGVTAVAGQVLLPDGEPLAGVTVSVGDRRDRTDHAGRFLLADLAAGHHVLVADGGSAGTSGREFGRFEIGVDLVEGETHQLPFPVWMSRLDTAHAVSIPSPTTEDTVGTTPLIPGFEVRLPAGTVIEDRDGEPVSELTITPVPVDQPPFPLPAGVVTPVYFTVQPGGAVVLPEGAQIVYPNTTGLAAGTRAEFWDYDAERVPCTKSPVKSYPKPQRTRPAAAPAGCGKTGAEAGWYVYGHGTVTDDGTQIVPDPDVRVWEFTGTMINSGLQGAAFGPGEWGAAGGDPVDLGTGLFVEPHTDLVVQDVIPISITRTYRQLDGDVRPFGIGTNFNYGIFLQSEQQYQEADLVLPDSNKVHFVRTSAGTGFTDAVFAAVETGGPYRDAVLAWNGRGWDLTRTDGLTFVFGDEQPLQAIRDRHGNQVTLTRTGGPSIIPGQGGDIAQITSPNGRWIRMEYAPGSNRIVAATDNGGRTVQYGYDEQGRLTEVTSPGGRTTTYTYDAEHRLTSITDPRGITYLTNSYDSEGRVASQQLPDGATYQFDYTTDAEGDITATEVTDAEVGVTRTEFDAQGRVVTETVAVGTPLERAATTVRQPDTGLPTQFTDPYGRVTELAYGADGDLDSITTLAGTPDAEIAAIESGGPFRQLHSVTDQHGRTTAMTYDETGNITSVTDAEGRTHTYAYNASGQVTEVTDPAGNTTTFTYADGDLVAVTDPRGHTTRQYVDAVGRVTAVTDPFGARRLVDYGPDNEVLTTTDPLGNTITFGYDGNGNLTEVTDAKGHATSIGYNDSDRPVTVTDPLGNQSTQEYDLLGRITTVTDRNGDRSVTRYDALGRTTFIGYGETAGPSYQSTKTFSYDDLDRLTSIDDSAGGLLTLAYDELDQVTGVTTPVGTVGYSYDEAGRRSGMAVPGQPAVSYTYDDTGLVERITQGSSTVSWQRDAAGRPVRIDRPGVVAEYDYDQASQIVGVTYQTPTGDPIGDLRYVYGPDGKVVGAGGSLANVDIPGTGPTMTYDAADRLVDQGGQALSYDAEGRLAGDGTRTYTWNARGELTTVDGPGGATSFGYDPAGRRASLTTGDTTTEFLYDGPNLVQQRTGGAATVDRLTAGLDQTLLRTDASGTQAPVTDLLGSVLGLVDTGSGTLSTQYSYQPYGTVTTSGPASDNAQQYTGREYDADTGLLYNRARYYSPELGRFISQDPAGFGGGSTNLYQYALDDPVNLSDPYGDCPICLWIAVGALFGGSVEVGIGWGIATITGRKYTFNDGLRDFAIGAAVGGITGGAGASLKTAGGAWRLSNAARGADDFVDLVPPSRRSHILEGEVRPNGSFGGGHRAGTGFPGKSEFPASWSDDQIIHHISDVATDPASRIVRQRGNDVFVRGTRDGIEIEVLIRNGEIWTAYPTNVPRNP